MLLSKREPIHPEDAIGRASTASRFALHDVTQDARRNIKANNVARPVGIEPATTVARTLDPVLGRTDLKGIGCSSLRGGGGELGTNKNFDLWLQPDCTKLKLKLKLKHAI